MDYTDWMEMYADSADNMDVYSGVRSRHHERLSQKNQDEIDSFIGKGTHYVSGLSTKWYYDDLIAWTTKHCLNENSWKIVAVNGYAEQKPLYRDIATNVDEHDNCLVSGQMVVEKDNIRLIVTVVMQSSNPNYDIQVEALEAQEEVVNQLVKSLENYLKEHNFYRNKRISLTGGGIRFIPAVHRTWDSIIIDSELKTTIRRNTIGFLRNLKQWPQYGIPTKRGVILAGGPGAGKTIICKALMSEAVGITCLFSNAIGIVDTHHFSELYEIAQDLAPCIVFIEDIDSIGQERWGMYRGTPQLVSLLTEMDGISEKFGIVTVATTNNVEILDEALRKRPARFDRVITIPPPSPDLRASHIELLSAKISLNSEVKGYLVTKTEGFSPAQVQEALFGLVINGIGDEDIAGKMVFTTADVDRVISELKCKADRATGFNTMKNNGNVITRTNR